MRLYFRGGSVKAVGMSLVVLALGPVLGCQSTQASPPANAVEPAPIMPVARATAPAHRDQIPPVSPPSPSPKSRPAHDRDGDGIGDDVDLCPTEPEDFDGFQDEDGCPDPDNDGDLILDQNDMCPNVPGPKPDGCPIAAASDRDGDGVVDNIDKCPDHPEDMDGFQDADGCPDPDNDGDGILDRNDKCPNLAGPPPSGCPR